MNSAASLENHMVIGAAAAYESQNLEVTPEEEAAMDEMERKRKLRDYSAFLRTLIDVDAKTLCDQINEAVCERRSAAWAEKLFAAERGGDDKQFGALMLSALSEYRHSLAAQEIGS